MKTKLNWFDYWIGHCWMTGWQSIRHNFRMWADLMTSNYENYALLKEDDPESECIEWFWVSLGEDEVYSKEFIEYLLQMTDDVMTGKVETYSYSLDELMDELKRDLDVTVDELD
jgi:hypothetical protein